MANAIDQDQQWLLNCLTATLDTNQEVRSFAEASLNQASLQPGFGGALSKVAVNKELPLGLRQLAAVLLKQFIKKHWQEGEETFEHPVVSREEKAVIRQLLLLSLDDPHGKICTAVGMAVASIAHYDWPEDWPDLLPFLLKLIGDQTNMHGVNGGLRCLALLSSDLDDTVVPTLVPVLFPCLHSIVSSPQVYDKPLRMKALSIVHSCTSMLGVMSGMYKSETSALMLPMLRSWMEQFSIILQPPVQSEDPDDWSIRMEVLKCLNQFVQNFPSLTESEFSVIVTPLWQTFVSSLKVYEQSSIQGSDDPYLGRYDSDGSEKSLESFVIQLFEFLLTIVGSSKLVKVIMKNVKELVYYTIPFLQITEQQAHTWSLDANQYLADEDEVTYSCRVSGSLLLEEVVVTCGGEGITAVIGAAQKRFSESQQEKAAGSSGWWRIREATIFALSSISEPLVEAQDSISKELAVGNLLEKILTEDIGTGINEYPFLHARVFSAVAKFTSMVSQGVLEQFLFAAIKAIGLDIPPPVKVGTCRAVSQLLPEANKEMLQPHIMGLLSSLTDLLKHASDETLHLVLETLQAAVKAVGHEASTSIESIISPIVLNMWAQHISDPFISIDAVEVLEAIKNSPGCIHPLVSRILPSIGPILDKKQPDGLVAGSLDLVTMLLKNAPIDIVKAVFDVCFNSVIRIVLQSDDHSELQNATECLATFVSGAKHEVLSWGVDPGSTMRSLLEAASRLLDPDLESSGSLFVGSYILQLILHLPLQMAQHIRDLITALVRRMQSCQIAALKSSLLVIFARLVHLSCPNVEQFIDLLITLPAKDHENALVYVMSEWTKQQGEIQGAYQIKVTTTALALLLSTRHVELSKIYAQGHLIKSTAGIVTRSKAKVAPDQWTMMTLPAKILALLADVLIEIQEQVSVSDDEDSDWEEDTDANGDTIQDLLYSSSTTFNKPKFEHLDRMAKIFNESHDDNDEDDLLSGSDPINEINLANFIVDFVIKFSNGDRMVFDHLFQNLAQAQQSAIQTVLNR
ncbi:PREDICTED: importin-9 isoform X2 [Nelumbo nucifera]|uniref:Importin-9 isoform X2 n=1 Tax=Nelumbo nucifera TaxID=4432 RepID=A0A1U8A4H4_NELNU|nr:PREDICTED: importin-9 isoform X2 [Nelumbo nucifera]